MRQEILRAEAIKILADKKYEALSESESEELLIGIWPPDEYLTVGFEYLQKGAGGEELQFSSKSEYKDLIITYFTSELYGVTNIYIDIELFEHNIFIRSQGRIEDRCECYCCGYKSLKTLELEICEVCGWESDGTSEMSEYSSPNHLTLLEAKLKYVTNGHIYRLQINPTIKIKYSHRSEDLESQE